MTGVMNSFDTKEDVIDESKLDQCIGDHYCKELDMRVDKYTRRCLSCEKVFIALGKYTRVCKSCKNSNHYHNGG